MDLFIGMYQYQFYVRYAYLFQYYGTSSVDNGQSNLSSFCMLLLLLLEGE